MGNDNIYEDISKEFRFLYIWDLNGQDEIVDTS
jgi:hypothetical protein